MKTAMLMLKKSADYGHVFFRTCTTLPKKDITIEMHRRGFEVNPKVVYELMKRQISHIYV